MKNCYNIPEYGNSVFEDGNAKSWLWVGIWALCIAGLYSVIVGAARTPRVTSMFPVNDIFHVSLVIHVDMSVVIWFLAFASIMWSLLPRCSPEEAYRRFQQSDDPKKRYTEMNISEVGRLIANIFMLSGLLIMSMSSADLLMSGKNPLDNYMLIPTTNLFSTGLYFILFGLLIIFLTSPVKKHNATQDGIRTEYGKFKKIKPILRKFSRVMICSGLITLFIVGFIEDGGPPIEENGLPLLNVGFVLIGVTLLLLGAIAYLFSIPKYKYKIQLQDFKDTDYICHKTKKAMIIMVILGTALMAAAPFISEGEPFMNNYIPVLTNEPFQFGLFISLLGFFIYASISFFHYDVRYKEFQIGSKGIQPKKCDPNNHDDVIKLGIMVSIFLILGVFFIYFFTDARLEQTSIEGEQYYEILFWGMGHFLQLVHVQLLMVAWLWMLGSLGLGSKIPPRLVYYFFQFGFLVALTSVIPFLLYDIDSQEHMDFFTDQMIWGTGTASGLLGLFVIYELLFSKKNKSLLRDNKSSLTCLIMSLVLFYTGGLFGLMIEGETVLTPAHYHGSIVGITIAFMGVVYLLLPRFGYMEVIYWKTAIWQPVIYGVGQMVHISALAWSGGYGVLRKTPGELEGIFAPARIAMGFMGAGMGLSVIGGFLFVYVVFKSYSMRPKMI